MYDRILVPVDGSKFSEEVIPYARGIAQSTGARMALLRVVDKDVKRVEAQRYVETLAKDFGAEVITITSAGDVSADILKEANRVPSTLVAITSHGRGGVLSVMLGSVARNLVRSGHAPVFVYRPGGSPDGHLEPVRIRTVLLPLDGSSLAESAQDEAAALARALHANVVVVQVLRRTCESIPCSLPTMFWRTRTCGGMLGRLNGTTASRRIGKCCTEIRRCPSRTTSKDDAMCSS